MAENERDPVGSSSYRFGSQVLVLVFQCLKGNDRAGTSNVVNRVDHDLYERFRIFMAGRHKDYTDMVVSKLSFAEERSVETPAGITKMIETILLTRREKEVLKLVVKGCSNREIAKMLFISDHTVKNHLTNIFQKIGVHDRTQAMAKVYQMNEGYGC
ncbi:hypothetical protein E2980_13995 [Cohnella luojiensis]|uniref:HTH luxR-type domain-containing protein n=1 Tax=Cohnella luojiensis TaxID=652876 RepID=A0A4Y8LWF9_9BACL|nr:hypothetical protein E2980_13995 [Cohnella luojiensis]